MERHEISISTHGRGTIELTKKINTLITKSGKDLMQCHLFLQHTSASLILCENADPDVLIDLEMYFAALIKDGDSRFCHTAEGADDMPAHIRTVLTQNSITIPIINNTLALGTWQGVFLWEHRIRPHHRTVIVTLQ